MQKTNKKRKTRTPKRIPIDYPYQVFKWCTAKKCNREREHIERVSQLTIVYECKTCHKAVEMRLRV